LTANTRNRKSRRGSTLIEFALIALTLLLVIFAGIEFDRMALVYTTMANSSRVGVRYAIVHGGNRTGSGSGGPSGPGSTAQVENVVRNFAGIGLLNTASLNVAVTYPAGSNAAGLPVVVTVAYPYDPLTVLPLGITLRSTTRGIIVY
jgi:Flp pilus assembly protein TadG